MNWRSITALLLLAFAGGAAAFAWANSDGRMPWDAAAKPVAMAQAENAPLLPAPVAAPGAAPLAPAITQLSNSQAEAQLLVMSVRRAVEVGKPLGDLMSRLQASFGQSQPQLLATINASARAPISNAALLKEFDAIAPTLALPSGTAWDRARYEMATLFVLRRTDAKPTAQAARVATVRELILSGDIATAARMVQALPSKAAAYDWLANANRAIAVRQALDSLDRATTVPPVIPLLPPVPAPAPAPAEPIIDATMPEGA
jgi:hypothetical protein